MTHSPEDDERSAPTMGPMVRQTAGADSRGASGSTGAGPRATSRGDNALEAGTALGEFDVEGVLGYGGFSIVYAARHRLLRHQVAIKEYMPSSLAERGAGTEVLVRSERHRESFEVGLRSFINEAQLLLQFDHPSLVKVYHFWEANGTAYMAMPLYEGRTLKQMLAAMDAPPDEAWLLDLLAPLTAALAVMHAKNCFHRDVAPDNVLMLAGSGRPLLLDFGAARRVIGDMTHDLTVILKPGYAPVEQYAQSSQLLQGPWTDVYALGALVHYAIMGRPPQAAADRLIRDNYAPLSDVASGRYSARFLAGIDRALRVRPDDRTASIADFRQDLGLPPLDAAASTVVSPLTAPATSRRTDSAPASSGRRGVTIGVISTGLLALTGGGAWLLGSREGAHLPAPAALPAAPPAVPTSQPEQTPAGFDVRYEFDLVLARRTAGFVVDAKPAQPVFRVGHEQLRFEIKSSRDGYAYVIVLEPNGQLMLMFPNTKSNDNFIRAGETLHLPQANWPLDVVEPAGRAEFLVIVSNQPRDYSELSRQTSWIFLKLPTGTEGADAKARWTHSTPWLLGRVASCPTVDCEAYGAATFAVDTVH